MPLKKAADVVIINTCGFILDAKEESVDTILSYMEEKQTRKYPETFCDGLFV